MKAVLMKQKLLRFIETREEKRLKTIYDFFEKEIEEEEWDYTDEFKNELDKRYNYYINGGEMVSAADANNQINKLVMELRTK